MYKNKTAIEKQNNVDFKVVLSGIFTKLQIMQFHKVRF